MELTDIGMAEELLAIYTTTKGFKSLALQARSDSIAHGVLGANVFALELYRCTEESGVIKDLRSFARRLRHYTECTRTNNHSLLKGRLGAAFFYLELFGLTGDQEFLDLCVWIVRAYWDVNARQLRFSDFKGLEDGTAGMVLFYLRLYDVIRQEWLLACIEHLILSLIGRLHLGQSGIYWSKDLFREDAKSVWASDTAAAVLCCFEAGRYFNNEHLCSLAREILAYYAGWGGAAIPETIGDVLVKAHLSEEKSYSPFEPLLSEDMPATLHNGLAGWGLGNKELFAVTGNPLCLTAARRASGELMERLADPGIRSDNLTFFNGVSGIGYAVLKIIQKNFSESLFFPRVSNALSGVTLKIGPSEVNKLLLRNSFGRTFSVIEDCLPAESDAFLRSQFPVNQNLFHEWMNGLDVEAMAKDGAAHLREVFQKEEVCNKLREQGQFRREDNAEYARRFDNIYTMDDKELLSLDLAVSKSGVIFRTVEDIDFTKPLTSSIYNYFKGSHAPSSYFFRFGKYNDLEARTLRILILSVDAFCPGCSVESAVKKTVDFLYSQKDAVIHGIFEGLETRGKVEYKNELSRIILGSIKWLYALGVLERTANWEG